MLGKEATTFLEFKAARFVRFVARGVSVQVTNYIVQGDGNEEERTQQESRAKVLAYLEQLQDGLDTGSSGDESDHKPDDPLLWSLDDLKRFMLCSQAFSDLCHSLEVWLDPDNGSGMNNTQSPPQKELAARNMVPVNTFLSEVTDQDVPDLLDTEDTAVEEAPLMNQGVDYPRQQAACLFSAAVTIWKRCRNFMSDLLQKEVPANHVRISWTCVGLNWKSIYTFGIPVSLLTTRCRDAATACVSSSQSRSEGRQRPLPDKQLARMPTLSPLKRQASAAW